MPTSDASTWTIVLRRIGLSFGSLLVAATLFSALLSLLLRGAALFGIESVFTIFYVAMIFACPIWRLSLPFVIAITDANGQRIRALIVSGASIGPASLALWALILPRRGANPHNL